MKTFVGSDFHWGHKNVMSFCPETRSRFRNDIAYMNEAMIKEWNALISPEDLIYLLGDIAFMSGNEAANVVNRLNGTKILVAGNHDVKTLKNNEFRSAFNEIHNYLEITYNGTKIVMCHYPIFDHNQSGRGSIMLHGHRHGKPHNIPGRIMDVGMDATGVIAVLLGDVIAKLEKIPHMNHSD